MESVVTLLLILSLNRPPHSVGIAPNYRDLTRWSHDMIHYMIQLHHLGVKHPSSHLPASCTIPPFRSVHASLPSLRLHINLSDIFLPPLPQITNTVSQEDMKKNKILLAYRDRCAALLVPLNECRKKNYYMPWACDHERHAYEHCEVADFQRRVKAMDALKAERAAAAASAAAAAAAAAAEDKA